MPWNSELQLAEHAALKAGEYLLHNNDYSTLNTEVSSKDTKLKADITAEKIITDIINKESKYPILSEEGYKNKLITKHQPIWIIDPLDGTFNYSRGIELCAVSIALYRDLEPILGIVYDFNKDELFSAYSGLEAKCNGVSITPSSLVEPEKSVLATGFPVQRDFDYTSLKKFLREIQVFKKIRLLGSAALSLVYVACGRVDAYYEEDIFIWDVAGGLAIASAAGSSISIKSNEQSTLKYTVKASGNDLLMDRF